MRSTASAKSVLRRPAMLRNRSTILRNAVSLELSGLDHAVSSPPSSSTRYDRPAFRSFSFVTLPDGQVILTSSA